MNTNDHFSNQDAFFLTKMEQKNSNILCIYFIINKNKRIKKLILNFLKILFYTTYGLKVRLEHLQKKEFHQQVLMLVIL